MRRLSLHPFSRACLARVIAALTLSAGVYGLSVLYFRFPMLTEKIAMPAARGLLRVIRSVTGVFSFSIAELLLLLSVPFAVFLAWRLVAAMGKQGVRRVLAGFGSWLALTAAVIYTAYSVLFGFLYARAPLAEQLNIPVQRRPVSELYQTTLYVIDGVNRSKAAVGNYDRPFELDFSAMADSLREAYRRAGEKYGVYSSLPPVPKPVLLSRWMCYTGISGVFFPYTGEANVNTAYQAYMIPFTAAHEMSHASLIAPEDEANFSAFLICLESDDPNTVYSGWLNALAYLLDPLYQADRTLYRQAISTLDAGAANDLNAYWDYLRQFEGKMQDFSNQVNDNYLKSNGQSDGVASYGRVADLLVGWYVSRVE